MKKTQKAPKKQAEQKTTYTQAPEINETLKQLLNDFQIIGMGHILRPEATEADRLHDCLCRAQEEISMIRGVMKYADETDERPLNNSELHGVMNALNRVKDVLTVGNSYYTSTR